jgi:tetratricopeptide (TPR) repeat protein
MVPAAVTNTFPNQVEAALALRSAGRLQEALDMLTAPSEYTSDFYTVRGEIQFALGRFQEAAGSYFTVVASEPDNTFAQYHLAVCLRHLNRWSEAAQTFQRVLDSDPHRDSARLGLGACLLNLRRIEEALATFDNCWSDASRWRALFGKAVALQLLGRWQEAEAAYQRLLISDPKSEEVLSNLIAMSIEAHDLEATTRYSTRLLDVCPRSTTALRGLAAVALERNEFEDAVRYCGRIVEQAPDCVEAWRNLRFATGRVMSMLQRPGAASTIGRK